MVIYFLTGNQGKVKSFRSWTKPHGIEVKKKAPSKKQPERKEDSLKDVARFKILDHKEIINAPFVVQDGGFFLEAQPGFPGPNVNHTLSTIGIEGILKMVPEDQRGCYFEDVLAFWCPELEKHYPGDSIRYFSVRFQGSVALTPSECNTGEAWSPLWTIFIPEGFQSTLAAMDKKERKCFQESINMPSKNAFVAFAEWIKSRKHLLYEQASIFDSLEENKR